MQNNPDNYTCTSWEYVLYYEIGECEDDQAHFVDLNGDNQGGGNTSYPNDYTPDPYTPPYNGGGGGGSSNNTSTTPLLPAITAEERITNHLNNAFGHGNWEFDDSIDENNANYVINNLDDLNSLEDNVTFKDVLTEITNVNANEIIILKTVRLNGGWGNSVDIDISCTYNKNTKETTNINSEMNGNVFGFGWTQLNSSNQIFAPDDPVTTNYDETRTEVEVIGYWHYTLFVQGIGTIHKSRYKISFIFGGEGDTSPIQYIKYE